MRAVQILSFGNPSDVVRFTTVEEPSPPKQGEVLVAMNYAPVNFADLLVIGGDFFHRPATPAILGNEGVGRVAALGEGVTHLKVGDLVIPPFYSGTWVERLVVPAADLFPLDHMDLQQAAMIRTNPPTADLMLQEFVDLAPGDWIVQNSANSGVGRAVIALAKARSVKTINLVRRAELKQELEDIGADLVLVDDQDALALAMKIVGTDRVALALDGVSGEATSRLAAFLTPGGTVVSYAMMSGDMSAPADLRPLIFKGTRLEFFYLGDPRWEAVMPASLRKVAKMVASGKIHAPVAAIYPLSQIAEAIAHTQRGGKVMLDIKAE